MESSLSGELRVESSLSGELRVESGELNDVIEGCFVPRNDREAISFNAFAGADLQSVPHNADMARIANPRQQVTDCKSAPAGK